MDFDANKPRLRETNTQTAGLLEISRLDSNYRTTTNELSSMVEDGLIR